MAGPLVELMPDFARAVLPETTRSDGAGDAGLALHTVGSLVSLVSEIAAKGSKRRVAARGGAANDE